MRIEGWSNFTRGPQGSSADKIIKTMNTSSILRVVDNKFKGNNIVILKESTLNELEVSYRDNIGNMLDRHLNIVEKLLDLNKNKNK